MKTTVITSNKTDKINGSVLNKIGENNAESLKSNDLVLNKDSGKNEPDNGVTKEHDVNQVQHFELLKDKEIDTESPKPVIKEQFRDVKPAMNLEQTLKWVETMHRRKVQRDKLVGTIDTLEAFEVAQLDDADETDNNHFQGCVLSIVDDNRKEFSTKNPFIIAAVASYVKSLCVDKLAEIEGEIVIPV